MDDLAYYLDTTKKAILRDAVADFADTHRPRGRYGGDVNETERRSAGGDPGENDVRGGSPVFSGAARGPKFEDLPVRERLELRRSELMRAFARREAVDIRVMNPRPLLDWDGDHIADEFAGGDLTGAASHGVLELLVTTEVAGGGAEAMKLEEIAREIIRAPVHVESATKLRLFSPARLEQAIADSRPL
ncbi:hypothetical protein LQ757_03750 [Agromyces sp. SYSU K20354]|uniref:hypothetical protein n=1 Tax=Agromyces cavernae TaxID=2898659 RepID=UPI001E50C08D|nr:hypothetical protein [Agromyces cavernae]MCD2441388.1 hypothetical protein [Agromyces cavernae]